MTERPALIGAGVTYWQFAQQQQNGFPANPYAAESF
jgi:hypothetical protein